MSDTLTNPENKNDGMVAGAFERFFMNGDPLWMGSRLWYTFLLSKLKDKRVIDVGCGTGIGTAMLGTQNTILGVDRNPESVLFASKLFSWMNWALGDISKPEGPFPGEVEAVVGIEVFEHIGDQKAAAERMMSIATEVVWLSTPNGLMRKKPPRDERHTKELSPMEMRELFPGKEIVVRDSRCNVCAFGKEPDDDLIYEVRI